MLDITNEDIKAVIKDYGTRKPDFNKFKNITPYSHIWNYQNNPNHADFKNVVSFKINN